jgi:hypothetical protein
MRNGIAKNFDSLADDVSLDDRVREKFKTHDWTYNDNSDSYFGNPARSKTVRDYLLGHKKTKAKGGKKSNRSIPLTYEDLQRILKFYDSTESVTSLNEYQIELMRYCYDL